MCHYVEVLNLNVFLRIVQFPLQICKFRIWPIMVAFYSVLYSFIIPYTLIFTIEVLGVGLP